MEKGERMKFKKKINSIFGCLVRASLCAKMCSSFLFRAWECYLDRCT